MLAIIGGTGLYEIEGAELIEELSINTPFGIPSEPIARIKLHDKTFFFLPRHGRRHQFLPHEINYRANIYALKLLGVRQIISISATGSLNEHIKPGDMALPTQYFDWVKRERESSFFGNGLSAHVSTADPVDPLLVRWIAKAAYELDLPIHRDCVYACIDGPRLSTRFESQLLQKFECDLIGMTNVPEAFLAKEAQICYATIAVITDFDSWMLDEGQHIDTKQAQNIYEATIATLKILLKELLTSELPATDHPSRYALKDAVISPKETLSMEQKAILSVLKE